MHALHSLCHSYDMYKTGVLSNIIKMTPFKRKTVGEQKTMQDTFGKNNTNPC